VATESPRRVGEVRHGAERRPSLTARRDLALGDSEMAPQAIVCLFAVVR
jgi:hypothetical protein